ncbi:carboxypeptidase-like regulatory domain-containing protein [Alistipes sp. ZOR0009]|jgi:hypothetical protein|uniref:carboxypeptidase-like regulatory domain-containing protein n=1 Tax=Alistipes sp. ZOR0009 TaxID=1339253 RepID=UPI00064566FE|nr:carboxypeptidase-like regulatory domain-containing protein [Alistipes sp. ZOR0009]
MKSTTINFYRALNNIIRFIKSSPDIQSYPAAKTILSNMVANSAAIAPIYEELQQDSSYLQDKVNLLVKNISKNGYPIGKAVESYAIDRKDPFLAKRIHTNYTQINRAGCNATYNYGKMIEVEALRLLEQLKSYRIDEQMLVDYGNDLTELKRTLAELDDFQQNRKHKNMQLEQYLKQSRTYIEQVDVFMETFRMQQPELYKMYIAIRKEKENINGITQIKVYDSETGEPVREAKVAIISTTRMENGKPLTVVERKTGKNGELRISELDYDIYDVMVTKIGCKATAAKLVVSDNSHIKLEIKLERLQLS